MKTKIMNINNKVAMLAFFIGISVYGQHSQPLIDSQSSQNSSAVRLNIKNLIQIAEVDQRYQSFNIEMCEVVGGRFWIPYELMDTLKGVKRKGGFDALKRTIPPVDLYQKKLRALAGALGPLYIRVSGTWANTAFFQDNDAPKLETAPKGFENVLTRKQWKGVIDFCRSIDAKLVTSFAISDGVRDQAGNWTPAQLEAILNYTRKAGGEIAAAELFNEPTHARYGGAPKTYNAEYFARDFAAFKSYVKTKNPKMKILGPGSTGEADILPIEKDMSTELLYAADDKPVFDIFSYHFYGGVSKRCFGSLTVENAMTDHWLKRTELGLKYYQQARDKYQPGKEIWLTETAESACGGNSWASTYVDCFRYLEQLGRLAQKDVKVVMHNTLASSEYGLLDQFNHDPRPNYWAALLWNRLMGIRVFEAGASLQGVDIFVHNLKKSSKGLAVLIVNPADSEKIIDLPAAAEQYLLTAEGENIQTKNVKLNGELLKLNKNNTLPKIKGKKIRAGKMLLPKQSIMFLCFKNTL